MRKAMMYDKDDDPTKGKFYVGQHGSMPKVGDPVLVTNALLDTEHRCTVSKLLRFTREYQVSAGIQLALETEGM